MPKPSKEHLTVMRKDFDNLDKDKSGFIGNKELANLIKLQVGREAKPAEVSGDEIC